MYAHRLHQVPDKVQHVQPVLKGGIEVAQQKMSNIKPISGPVGATVDTMGAANSVVDEVVTISETYLEPLRIFSVVATGISNVRPSN